MYLPHNFLLNDVLMKRYRDMACFYCWPMHVVQVGHRVAPTHLTHFTGSQIHLGKIFAIHWAKVPKYILLQVKLFCAIHFLCSRFFVSL